MDIQQEPAAEERKGVPTFAVEAGVAALVLLMGLVVTVTSYKLGAGWMSDGPGAGYFPFYVGLILCISGAGTLYQALLGKKRNHDIFVDHEQIKRVLMVLVPAVIYVFAIQFLGMYVASAIYIACFMMFLGKFSRVKSVLLGLAIAAIFFGMFEVWFKVPLHKGMLDPTRFLGY
jgi:hypothetical protein